MRAWFLRRCGPLGPLSGADLPVLSAGEGKVRHYVCVIVAAASLVAFAQTPPFDLLILNGRVIDGTGAAGTVTDIAIRDGRIVSVGRIESAGRDVSSGAATAAIDASGLVVSPGFIDVHTHADDIATRPLAENFAQMGVTTIVAGNCGSSALDVGAELDEIRNKGVSINFATLIGHNTVRQSVMGSVDRVPTIAEIARMKDRKSVV